MDWACNYDGKTKNMYRVLVEKPVVNRPFGRSRRRCDAGIKTDLREAGGTSS
jgi:hypothetical protein